jgi:ubiquinone/menaquinone biosynthesis C-methylase UbiE
MSDDFENIGLGKQKLEENDIDGAMHHLFKVLKDNKDHIELYLINFDLFCRNQISTKNYDLLKTIAEYYFRDNFIYHQLAFPQAIKLTNFYSNSKTESRKLSLIDLDIINEKLFQLIVKKCLITDLNLEFYLTKIRKKLLKKFLSNTDNQFFMKIYKFLIVFAEQKFFCEFIYHVTDEEKKLLKKLENKIKKKDDICELSILLISLYKPLNKCNYLQKKLVNYISKSNEFKEFLKYVFHDPHTDKQASISMKSMSNFSNKTSLLMKRQYEENPFPRWRFTLRPMKGNDINEFTNRYSDTFFQKPEILIAGCGTGQQAMAWSAYKDSKICAVDLSSESLAYAIRKAKEKNIKNINFYHLDLLDLELLNKKFDIIISTGCLHHMEKPEDGLESLVNVLKPQGLIYLGLYSKRARSEIEWTRKYIQKRKIDVTEDNMRSFRTKILNSENKKLQSIRGLRDFFSLSNFRDLLFNYTEHTYDFIKIKELLESKKLNFIAFNEMNPNVKNSFKNHFPNENDEVNLELWDKFEKIYPKTFLSMYRFWVKKKSNN